MRTAAVVGGGIAGLAAALRLAEGGVRVVLIEGSAQLGGKLRTVDGWEAAAENFLMRDPAGGPSAAVLLAQELGLGDQIVHPTGLGAALYLDGELKRLPAGTMLGIPAPGTDLGGVASVADADLDHGKPVLTAGEDVAVGELVRERLGDQVVTRLVDPLLGGVYAGRADRLSVAATMPALHRLLQTEHTLGAAVTKTISASRAHAAAQPKPAGLTPEHGDQMSQPGGRAAAAGSPMFGTVVGGLSRLVAAAAQRLAELGGEIRLGVPVRDLGALRQEFDGVVLAIPGGKARRLLVGTLELGEIEYASMALVTLALPPTELPELSGFLVPEGQGLSIKAATFFSRKWAHVDGTLVRMSLGRAGAEQVLQRPDAELVHIAQQDLAKAIGVDLPHATGTRVDRWGGGLPQYAPGHVTRVEKAREALPGNIKLAGAGYDGVGIPACVKSGWVAAQELLEGWRA